MRFIDFRLLEKDEVLDFWHAQIAGGYGKDGQILRSVETAIAQSHAPGMEVNYANLATGTFEGLIGKRRHFLVIGNTMHPALRPYKIHIGCEDYGSALNISWYLATTSSLLAKLLLPSLPNDTSPQQRRQEKLDALGPFEQQDLRGWVSFCHNTLLGAVQRVMAMEGDGAQMLSHKSGFLNIS